MSTIKEEENKPLVVILANENPNDHLLWIKACETRKNQVDYKVVNLSNADWFERVVENADAAHFLCRPPGVTSSYKQLYDERLMVLAKSLRFNVFPSLEECLIYENKRYLSYWLRANEISSAKTNVFYNKNEAISFLSGQKFPLVAKANIGASGSGICILRSKKSALKYINNTFERRGAKRRSGPNLDKGGILKRGMHYIFHPSDIGKKLKVYKTVRNETQTDFVILQEYIQHDFEWRVVRIGDSFFAHKKLPIKDKTSGSLMKSYENPPLNLLDFVKQITDSHQFFSQAIDIFESSNGYLVNEMQCIFGQSDPHQMLVNGTPGRYRYLNNRWFFEKGNFTTNQCYDLRIEHVIQKLQ